MTDSPKTSALVQDPIQDTHKSHELLPVVNFLLILVNFIVLIMLLRKIKPNSKKQHSLSPSAPPMAGEDIQVYYS